MDARSFRPVLGVASLLVLTFCSTASAQFGRRQQHAAQSQNFIVFASSPQWAAQVAEMAEKNRRELAIHWLGRELPPWSERVPVHVQAAPDLGAGGETRFSLIGGNRVGNWMMSVSGTQERILDSVLPHEITHTIFATHFAPLGKYVPRWADEGACTTVEHESEKRKHEHYLHEFLRTGRGLAFNKMLSLKDYPHDILPLYAQGHSAVQFLLDQGGPQKFVRFLEAGMRSEAWEKTLNQFYSYETIGQFQTLWNQWLADGSPEDLLAYAPGLQSGVEGSSSSLAADAIGSSRGIAAEVQLASNQATSSGAQTLGNESWYKRRLQEVSGGAPAAASSISEGSPSKAADSLRSHPHQEALAANDYPLRPYQIDSGNVASSNLAPPQSPRQPLASTEIRAIAAARAMPAQSPDIQVLDWGSSVPIPGIQQHSRQADSPKANRE